MIHYYVQLKLLSDTTFSRGDGVAGLIDREVEHDKYGLPYLHGRTLKGLLGEEADNLLDVTNTINEPQWKDARDKLFGQGGSDNKSGAGVHYSHAQLPEWLQKEVADAIGEKQLSPAQVLASLTTIRRQTAVNGDGIPHDGSLRSMRVILRQTTFTARLSCGATLQPKELALLAAAVLALRRAGTGRNRGRGFLEADLLDESGDSILQQHYQTFLEAIL